MMAGLSEGEAGMKRVFLIEDYAVFQQDEQVSGTRPLSVSDTRITRRSCSAGSRVRRPASCIRRSDFETVEWSRPTAASSSDCANKQHLPGGFLWVGAGSRRPPRGSRETTGTIDVGFEETERFVEVSGVGGAEGYRW